VNQADKQDLLSVSLLDEAVKRSLVFTRTKHGADRIVKRLAKVGILAVAIHGNKSQGQRTRALEDYRSGKVDVLVATDIAARGIDIPNITHVFNFEIPNVPEQYVHRIGRTARAEKTGIAIAFVDKSENNYLRDIEKLLKEKLPKMDMPAEMNEKLKELKSRTPLPPPEKPKPDARKGRGKSKKKGRFSKSEKKNETTSRSERPRRDRSDSGEERRNSKSKDHRQKRDDNAPKQGDERPAKKSWSNNNENRERTRRDKPRSERPNGDRAKSDKPSSDSERPRSEPSAEGQKAQSYSGKGYRGKNNRPASGGAKTGKPKPSRAKRKAARQASGKTKPR